MPNPNAIVAKTIQFDPPLEGRRPEEAIGARGGLAVDLGEGRRVRLDPEDRRSTGFVRVLDELSKQRRPAYVEVNPDTESIERLLIPMVARVLAVRPAPEGRGPGIEVELDRSHARHLLPVGMEDSASLERELRAALESRQLVLVVEDFEGKIIDVREFTPDPEGPVPPLPGPGGPGIPRPRPDDRWWIRWPYWVYVKLSWWVWYPFWWFRCPSEAQAQAIFDAMAATSCDPVTVPPPCIPFLYPENGCWARAHEMCRLIKVMGRTPDKVWIDGSLHVISANTPTCNVYWSWHVAPTLCVRTVPWQTKRVVIDPSLFDKPVSEADWKLKQGDLNAVLTNTDQSVYLRPPYGPPTDPNYVETVQDLALYRTYLYNQTDANGPPPYTCP
jgi:hypothetical protein